MLFELTDAGLQALIGFTEPLADEAGVNVEEYLDSHPNIRTAIHDNGCLEIVLDDRSLFLSPIALSSK